LRQCEGSGDEVYSGEDEEGNDYIAEVEMREKEMSSKNTMATPNRFNRTKKFKQRDRDKDKEKVKKFDRSNKVAQSLTDNS